MGGILLEIKGEKEEERLEIRGKKSIEGDERRRGKSFFVGKDSFFFKVKFLLLF